MYLSRVTLTPTNPRALLSLIGARMKPEDPSFAHKMIWTLFADDPEAKRDFLFEVVQQRPFQALIRSARLPKDDIGCWTIESIPFAPQIAEGQRLRFSLTAVAARAIPATHGKRGTPVDIVMAQWRTLPDHRRTVIRPDDIAEPVAREWLEVQGQRHGFVPEEDVVLLAYNRHRFPNRSRPPITFGSLRLTGHLTVSDADAFQAVLRSGLGRARGFGFGLLQIAPAPPRRPTHSERDEPLVITVG